MGIGYESPDVVASGIVTSDLDQFTASLPRLGATVGEARERLFDVHERRLQSLVEEVSG